MQCLNLIYLLLLFSIGFSIAKRLAEEGAKVVISSRKESNVMKAVEQLKSEGLQVSGTTCHVGKKEDRAKLFENASVNFTCQILLFIKIKQIIDSCHYR